MKREVDLSLAYRLIAPRPVVIITTVDSNGRINAAPFSLVCPVSFDPPRVMFCTDPEHDTYLNVKETKEFVINVPPADILDKVWETARDYPRGVNELEKAGLKWEPSLKVKPPRVVECVAHLECVYAWEREVGDHVMIVGDVVAAFVNEDCIDRSNVLDVRTAKPLLHVGRNVFVIGDKRISAKITRSRG
ncbi:MAG: flavin reductase family protein [Candidatus Baldrarchaeia archaeon]